MCPLLFSAAPTPVSSTVTLLKSTHWFILSPPSISAPLWVTICWCWLVQDVDRLLIHFTHTHTHAQQSPHQVWLIWLVTRVSRAITGIQMFHSPFVYTPTTHTHLLSSPPLAFSSWGCDAACSMLLFWLFLLFSLSSLWVVTALHQKKEVCFSQACKDCIKDLRAVIKGEDLLCKYNTQAPSSTDTHTFSLNVITTIADWHIQPPQCQCGNQH